MLTHRDFPFTSESLMDNLWGIRGVQGSERYPPQTAVQTETGPSGECGTIPCPVQSSTRTGRYIWNKDKKAEIDAVRFENLVSEGDSLMESNATKAVDAYKRALDIYEGGLPV